MEISNNRFEGRPPERIVAGTSGAISSESGGSGGRFESVDKASPFECQCIAAILPQHLAKKEVAAKTFVFFRRVYQYSVSCLWPQPRGAKKVPRNILGEKELRRDFFGSLWQNRRNSAIVHEEVFDGF
jgi:hypothetical protein